jgi:translation initiation factor IF-1
VAVAKNQIEEILDVVKSRIGKSMTQVILDDLTKTEAYIRNKSFRNTVIRLQSKYIEQHFNFNKDQSEK